jgi:hypothetical protein
VLRLPSPLLWGIVADIASHHDKLASLVLSLVGFGLKVPRGRISARCKASQGLCSRCDAGRRKGAPKKASVARQVAIPASGKTQSANTRPLGRRGAPACRDTMAANSRTQGCEPSGASEGHRQPPRCWALPPKRGGFVIRVMRVTVPQDVCVVMAKKDSAIEY